MNVFDFITEAEIDDLPDHDPRAAFTTFVRIAQRRLTERTTSIDASDESGWYRLEEARYGFMNVVIGAAKKYNIDPFATRTIPRLTKFDIHTFRQFAADLDHYITQLVLDNSSRARRDSVLISPELKTSIRTYVHHLRELIEKSDDLEEGKRQVLLRRLGEFEAELDRKRLSLLSVTILAITLLSAPGGIWASADLASKLLTNILRVVGEAKIADDATRRLPSSEMPMAITGPRPEDSNVEPPRPRSEMDDEIPF